MDGFLRRRIIIFIILVSLIFFLFGLCNKFYISGRSDNIRRSEQVDEQFKALKYSKPFKTAKDWKSTPAKRRLNMGNRKCNVFTQLDKTPFTKATLKFSRGNAVMYVYNKADRMSRTIMDSKQREIKQVKNMEFVFDIDPKINLIDIGCNLGVYTVVAAMRNRKVVAVDANINNMKRLRRSLVDNKVAKNVKLLYNAISDKYATFSLKTTKGNIGNTYHSKLKSIKAHPVKSILLDDILEVVDFNRAILKIDIKEREYGAFHKADKLFKEVDIPIVMMKWGVHRKTPKKSRPAYIISFFTKIGYKAYKSVRHDKSLDNKKYKTWPRDIVWKQM